MHLGFMGEDTKSAQFEGTPFSDQPIYVHMAVSVFNACSF